MVLLLPLSGAIKCSNHNIVFTISLQAARGYDSWQENYVDLSHRLPGPTLSSPESGPQSGARPTGSMVSDYTILWFKQRVMQSFKPAFHILALLL